VAREGEGEAMPGIGHAGIGDAGIGHAGIGLARDRRSVTGLAGIGLATIGRMTVAAVILAASPESALADADGLPRVRRIVDAAWSGGALPVVVVSFDPDGAIAAALAGAAVTLAEPVPKPDGVPVAQIRRGIQVARDTVRDVDAALVWPARMGWVSPETVTSMIEAHGVDTRTLLRPSYDGEEGWPVLIPTTHAPKLDDVAPDRFPDDIVADVIAAGVPARSLPLGDPGTTHDGSIPRGELPPYSGPTEPAAPHTHEWGAALADAGDDNPLEGPALAPYGQAVAEDPDQPG
jgi:CTP:molybdopterin cytidylyltransferase MocA